MQYAWGRYRSISSATKCPLEITADDYFVTSNGEVFDAIQSAYIVLLIMGYLRVPCQVPSFCLLCFVYVSVCASVYLEIHSPKNTNKITDVRALTCTTFHFIFIFNCFFIGLKNMHVFIW